MSRKPGLPALRLWAPMLVGVAAALVGTATPSSAQTDLRNRFWVADQAFTTTLTVQQEPHNRLQIFTVGLPSLLVWFKLAGDATWWTTATRQGSVDIEVLWFRDLGAPFLNPDYRASHQVDQLPAKLSDARASIDLQPGYWVVMLKHGASQLCTRDAQKCVFRIEIRQ